MESKARVVARVPDRLLARRLMMSLAVIRFPKQIWSSSTEASSLDFLLAAAEPRLQIGGNGALIPRPGCCVLPCAHRSGAMIRRSRPSLPAPPMMPPKVSGLRAPGRVPKPALPPCRPGLRLYPPPGIKHLMQFPMRRL